MVQKGFTKKRCHGCGEIPAGYKGRPAEGVCDKCSRILKWAKRSQAKLDAQTERSIYRMPVSSWCLPHLRHCNTSHFSHDKEEAPGYTFQVQFQELLRLIGGVAPPDRWTNSADFIVNGVGDGFGPAEEYVLHRLIGRAIIKIRDRYFEWSTIVDAPVSYAMTREEIEEYIQHEYGQEGLSALPARMKRVEEHGSSYFPPKTLAEVLSCNRAGDNEKEITADQIYEKYLDAS